jgi:hypothetical protein
MPSPGAFSAPVFGALFGVQIVPTWQNQQLLWRPLVTLQPTLQKMSKLK